MHLPFLFLLIALWATGCSGQECDTITDPQATVEFARYNSTRTAESNITVAFSKIYGIGGKQDGSLISTDAPVGRVRLQLSQNADTTAFVFVQKDGPTDTLTVTYSRQPFFISQACGFEMRYDNLTLVSHTFTENPVILKPAVTAAVNEVHLKIYY